MFEKYLSMLRFKKFMWLFGVMYIVHVIYFPIIIIGVIKNEVELIVLISMSIGIVISYIFFRIMQSSLIRKIDNPDDYFALWRKK